MSAALTALVIGDPHFKIDNVVEMMEMSTKLLEHARALQPSFIVCLGDVLHTHDRISMIPLVKATQFLDELRQIAPLYLLIGNHDRLGQSVFLTDEHPFTSLKSWKNTVVVDKVFEDTIQGRRFLFIPYVPPGRFNEALQTIVPSGMELPAFLDNCTGIFAHQEFRNAKMGPIISAQGDEWPQAWPYIISGHIHDYDELAPNIIYVGTPLQHAFNENSDKTVSLFTWQPDNVGSMLIIPQHRRIDLQLTKKKIIHLTCAELANYTAPTGYMLKIVVTGTSAEIKAAMKLATVKQLIDSGIKVVYKDIPSTVAPSEAETPITGPVNTMRFAQRLYSAMAKDAELVKQFEKLFGPMNQPIMLTMRSAAPKSPPKEEPLSVPEDPSPLRISVKPPAVKPPAFKLAVKPPAAKAVVKLKIVQ